MTKKPLYMETTELAASKTAAEICQVLVAAGATQINTEYDAGKVTGLRWTMPVNGRELLFSMPARVEPIYKLLKGRNRNTWLSDKEKAKIREKAERVAWRQLLRWVQAQTAMIETGMVEAAEVFMPYRFNPATNRTMFEHWKDTELKALPAPEVQ